MSVSWPYSSLHLDWILFCRPSSTEHIFTMCTCQIKIWIFYNTLTDSQSFLCDVDIYFNSIALQPIKLVGHWILFYFQRKTMLMLELTSLGSSTVSRRILTSTRSQGWERTSRMWIFRLWTGSRTTGKLKHFSSTSPRCSTSLSSVRLCQNFTFKYYFTYLSKCRIKWK